MRFMEHWRSVLPANRFLEIDYETLVDSSDETIRKLIDCLELPWEDGCLNHQSGGNTIMTPSRWQARQPIYRSSVQRWKDFEPWLGAFSRLKEVSHPPL